jgi:hypothetical protein
MDTLYIRNLESPPSNRPGLYHHFANWVRHLHISVTTTPRAGRSFFEGFNPLAVQLKTFDFRSIQSVMRRAEERLIRDADFPRLAELTWPLDMELHTMKSFPALRALRLWIPTDASEDDSNNQNIDTMDIISDCARMAAVGKRIESERFPKLEQLVFLLDGTDVKTLDVTKEMLQRTLVDAGFALRSKVRVDIQVQLRALSEDEGHYDTFREWQEQGLSGAALRRRAVTNH